MSEKLEQLAEAFIEEIRLLRQTIAIAARVAYPSKEEFAAEEKQKAGVIEKQYAALQERAETDPTFAEYLVAADKAIANGATLEEAVILKPKVFEIECFVARRGQQQFTVQDEPRSVPHSGIPGVPNSGYTVGGVARAFRLLRIEFVAESDAALDHLTLTSSPIIGNKILWQIATGVPLRALQPGVDTEFYPKSRTPVVCDYCCSISFNLTNDSDVGLGCKARFIGLENPVGEVQE